MKKIVIGLTVVLLSLLIFGCKDINNPDTEALKTENENQNEIENQKQVVNGGVLQGKALYSNSNDSSSIQVILDKTDRLFTEQLLELTNQNANQDRAISSAARTVVSYQNCAKDGSYEFSNLEEGNYTVYATSPDSTEKAVFKSIVVGKDQTIQVPQMTLTATGAISGKITLDGSTDNNAGFVIFAGGTSFMAVTALDGSFTLSGLPANTSYQIIVMRGAYTHLWKNDEQAEPLGNTYIGELNLDSDTIKLTGKDGQNGTNGINGLNGIDGINGTNGTNGTDGKDGKDGISIIWKGSFPDASALSTPQYLWAYFNTTDGCSYIYDGHTWTLLASSGENKSESSNAKVMLTYNLDHGTLPAGAPQVHTYGKVTQLMEPTREGYYFKGYYLYADFSGEPVTTLGNDYIIGQTLYAKWIQCKAIYYYTYINGDSNLIEKCFYTLEEYETAVLKPYSKPGYTFEGWNTQTNFLGATYQAGKKLNEFMNNSNTCYLYAKLTPITYHINYICGNATNNASNPTEYTAYQTILILDGTYNSQQFKWVISGTNTTCTGWAPGEQIGDITLEIDISYRITYELNSGTNNSQNPEKFKTDQNVTLYEPTREGYTFTGWWLDEECETTQISGWNAGEKNEHITIYAGWTSAEVQRILAMTQSDTVKLEGEYSGGDITSIRKALQKLYSQNPNIKITLDLSDLIVDENYLIFSGTNNIISVTLPKSAETVTTKAFFECANLKKIIIPEDTSNTEPGIFSFGDYSFANCPNLKVILNYSNKVLYADGTFLDGSKGYPMEFYDLGGSPFSGTILFMNGGGTRPAKTSTTPPVQTNDGFRFAYINDTWYLVDYEGESTNMILPDSFSLDGTTITEYSIYNRSFNYRKDITSITISSSVTNMGTSTFEGCSELTSISFTEGILTPIEESAFKDCTGLTSITIPSTITEIKQNAFMNCTGLTRLIIPANITSIGSSAFGYCTNLTSLTIEEGMTGTIGGFSGCTGLTSIKIPESVTNIGNSAFAGCTGITSLTIPEGVTSIGNYAFADCTGIINLTISEGVTSIGNYAFAGCTGLTNINIPSSVITIGSDSFENCTGIENVTIKDGVRRINKSAFYNCTNLTSITIPSSVERIDQKAFYNSGLQRVIIFNPDIRLDSYSFAYCPLGEFYLNVASFDDAYEKVRECFNENFPQIFSIKPPVQTEEGFLFICIEGLSGEAQWQLVRYTGSETEITLPSSFECLGETINNYGIYNGAFFNRVDITKVSIPNSVNSIEKDAFYGSGLTEIEIPLSVTFLGDTAFSNCTNLTKVTVSATIIRRSDYSNHNQFYGCPIRTLILRNDITSISSTFSDWWDIYNVILPETLTNIGEYAFKGCTNLTSITIPDNVTSIGSSAFEDCSNLENVHLPSNLQTIESSTFKNCKKLANINIPGNVTTIGDYSFQNCSSLSNIIIPESVTTIGSNSFQNCTNLSSIIISEGVTTIGSNSFQNCFNLSSIIIPESVTTIGQEAFHNCNLQNLTLTHNPQIEYRGLGNGINTVTISEEVVSNFKNIFYSINISKVIIQEGVTIIPDSAFSARQDITMVILPESLTEIGEYAFGYDSSLESVIFEDPNNWWVTSGSNYAVGQPYQIDCSNPGTNAQNIKGTWSRYVLRKQTE